MRILLAATLAALLLAGCDDKPAAPQANLAEAIAAGQENGTASDVTAIDATVGTEANMVLDPAPAASEADPRAARPAPAAAPDRPERSDPDAPADANSAQ